MDDQDPETGRFVPGNSGGAGRPSTYRPEYDELAFKYCLLGATNDELARFFGAATADTVEDWMRNYPSFAAKVRAGKEEADAEVAHRLYKRTETSDLACIYWLNNRRRQHWRQRVDNSHANPDDTPLTGIQVNFVTPTGPKEG